MKTIQIIPKNIQFLEARILEGEEGRELYQEAQAKAKKRFGEQSQAYKTIMNGINVEDVTGSQYFFNTHLNSILPKGQRVITLEDMEQINNQDESFFRGFYTDTTQLVLRTKNPSFDKNKRLLEHLTKQLKGVKYSSENPAVISGLSLANDRSKGNEYGLVLKAGKDMQVVNDQRFAYSNHREDVQFGEKTKESWAKKEGLSGLFLGGDSSLDSDCGNLADSYGGGRVVVVDTAGVAPQKLLANLQEDYNNLRKKVEKEKKELISRIQKL